jgi:hypothetical protein
MTLMFAALFVIYKTPWGLMDDYRNILLIKDIIENPLQTYWQFTTDRIIIDGMFQPFYLPQMLLQYYPGIIFSPVITYIINALVVFFIHYYFFKSFEKIIDIDYKISLFIFLIWPYTYDLFVHPSLQEKYIFLMFAFLLREILKPESNSFKIVLLSFLLPLLKLQGAIFIGYFAILYFRTKQKNLLLSIYSFSVAILIQGYIIFFIETEYFIYNSSFQKIYNNLGNTGNLLFLLLIIIVILTSITGKNLKYIHITGLSLSAIFLIFIYSNWNIYGYLLASYSFFISIFIPYLFGEIILKLIKSKRLVIFQSVLCIFMVFSVILFFLPRLERWQQLTYVNNELQTHLDYNVYYCAEEGARWLNQIEGNKNKITHVNSYKEINDRIFYFINDTFQCDYFTQELKENCVSYNTEDYISKKFYLSKHECST